MKHKEEIADNEAAGKAELQREQLVRVGFPREGLRGCTTSPRSRAVSSSSASFLEDAVSAREGGCLQGEIAPGSRCSALWFSPCLLLCSDLHHDT